MGCPDTEELAALMSPALDAGRRAAILDHAAGCGSCHSVMAELASGRGEAPAAGTSVPAGGAVDARARIGRYHLLEIVGAGGMGVVWGAWDPELARRVALKLVHPRIEAARARMIAEGQALAKLSHPNVVPVYDVGVVDDQVYLVMEWVQGTTLRAYAASGCSLREVVAAYRQAGDGLAAAHRAGLVHRDFKPDNAIRGEDGRVRVLDFGLARSEAEAPEPGKRLAGTPRYMPPEQAAGEQVTPAADQYAFARSLEEALGGGAELPGWVAGPLARATATAPAERFPSMAELLSALGRDPVRLWRRRGLAALAVAAAAAAFVVGRAHGGETCVGSAAEVARSWNPAIRAALVAHVRGLGAFGAGEADRLGDALDRYGAAWSSEHHGACAAYERGELPAALYERRITCLARGRAALATIAELMTDVPVDGLASALVAARSLPSATGCAAADASPVPPPPDAVAPRVAALEPAIERARVLAVAARPDAVVAAQAAVTAAEQTGYAPVIARALLVRGRAELELHVGEAPPRASLERATDLALRGGDDVLAVEAYARLVFAVGSYHGDVVGNWTAMEAIAARTGPAGRFGRALLYNNKGVARNAESDRAGARGWFERALAASPVRPLVDSELELVTVLQNLALAIDDPVEREAHARELVAYLGAVLGPNHPNTLAARVVAGMLTRDPVAADAELQAACDGYQRWHPERSRALAGCAFERGWLADDRGDAPGARAAMRLAAGDPRSARDDGTASIAAAYLAITGEADALPAVGAMQALAAAEAALPEWWNRGEAARAYVIAALGWGRLGKPRDAERCWSAALALLESAQQPMFERLLARVRATLAERWRADRPDDARRLASAALAWYRAAGGYDRAVAELAPVAGP